MIPRTAPGKFNSYSGKDAGFRQRMGFDAGGVIPPPTAGAAGTSPADFGQAGGSSPQTSSAIAGYQDQSMPQSPDSPDPGFSDQSKPQGEDMEHAGEKDAAKQGKTQQKQTKMTGPKKPVTSDTNPTVYQPSGVSTDAAGNEHFKGWVSDKNPTVLSPD